MSDLSDHCPLEIEFRAQLQSDNVNKDIGSQLQNSNFSTSNINNLRNNFNKRFYLGDSTIDKLLEVYNNDNTNDFLDLVEEELSRGEISIDDIVSKLRSKLLEISEICFVAKENFWSKSKETSKARGWFDSECHFMKQTVSKARKLYQESVRVIENVTSNINPNALRNIHFQKRREYKKLLEHKRRLYLIVQKQQLWTLRSESPKSFWKRLSKRQKTMDLGFQPNQLFEYFNNLLLNSSDVDNREIVNYPSEIDQSTL